MNNIPKGKTEEEIVEFLEKHTKLDITVRVTSGIEIDNAMSTVEKIDFRVTRYI